MRIGTRARVASDEYAKGDPSDFALWKKADAEDEAVGAAWDDVLDACALVQTARRLAGGQVERLGDGARDARGLRCEIVL